MGIKNVRFHNGGYCKQLARFAGANSWRVRRFYAVFLTFEHSTHGKYAIDTGYGPAIRSLSSTWLGRVFQWLLPVPRHQAFEQPGYLESVHRIAPNTVRGVILSHFHADHIAGLSLFGQSNFVYRRDTLEQLQNSSSFSRHRHSFYPSLLPDDFMVRSMPIDRPFLANAHWEGVATLDFFGDGSLIMIDLPGHALGHTGYLLQQEDGTRYLYIVDAFWDFEVWRDRRPLPWIARQVANDARLTLASMEILHRLAIELSLDPIACHCPLTQNYVENTSH